MVRKSMNNLLSYLGLVDARISASEKDLPVMLHAKFLVKINGWFIEPGKTSFRR